MNKKIIIFGGGSGLSNLLEGLKLFPLDIVAVVSVSDNGGSSGIIRKLTNLPAIGDLRKVYTSLSEDKRLNTLLNYRFTGPLFKNHPVGNIILVALYELCNHNLEETLSSFEEILRIRGMVLPVSYKPVILKGIYEDKTMYGETEIHGVRGKIINLENVPNDAINKSVLDEIGTSDMIIYSSGSLYTSTLACLNYPNVIDALSKTHAKKIYVSNIMTEKNETFGFKMSSHVNEIIKYLGKNNLDIVIANNDYKIDNRVKYNYKKRKGIMVYADKENIDSDIEVILTKLWEEKNGLVRHDSFKLARLIFRILYEE